MSPFRRFWNAVHAISAALEGAAATIEHWTAQARSSTSLPPMTTVAAPVEAIERVEAVRQLPHEGETNGVPVKATAGKGRR